MEGKNTASKIKDTIAKISELEAVQRHYESTVAEYNQVVARKERVENRMIKELDDVTKLEQLGVKSIFYNVLGSKEKQLEKERQEYLQATLEHKEVVNALEVVEFEKNILEKKLTAIDDLEEELNRLKNVREKEIMAVSSALRNELKLIYDQMDSREKIKAEISEAFVVGQQTFESLEFVRTHLSRASDWGQWDRSKGRGAHHRSLKYSSIDRAMNEVSRSKLLLRKFNKELTDVGYSNLRLALQIESIEKFTGIIFDNLISDWIIQNKISSALSTVESLMDDIKLILNTLLKDKTNNQAELMELKKQKDHLLEEN